MSEVYIRFAESFALHKKMPGGSFGRLVAGVLSIADIEGIPICTVSSPRLSLPTVQGGFQTRPHRDGAIAITSFANEKIRNEKVLDRIHGYIANNPPRWADDLENISRAVCRRRAGWKRASTSLMICALPRERGHPLTSAVGGMPEQFEQLDELLVTLGANVGRS
jgi:hypothetical protein